MKTGPLNKRIKIQRRVESLNEFKETVVNFVDWVTVWAAVEPLAGREYIAAQQISGDITTRVRIRALQGVDRKMRVVYEKSATQTKLYEIDNVLSVLENNRELVLMCREVDTQGFRLDGSRNG